VGEHFLDKRPAASLFPQHQFRGAFYCGNAPQMAMLAPAVKKESSNYFQRNVRPTHRIL
jgi:hypothetical protein